MKNEKLQSWALIAEIVGGVAVISTLLLLLLGVRENTEAMKASTYDTLQSDLVKLRLEYATDNELQELDLYIFTNGRESLSPAQARLDSTINVALFMNFERAYIQWRAGNLDDSAWERFRRSLCSVSGIPTFEESVGPQLDRFSTDSFTNYRKTQCED